MVESQNTLYEHKAPSEKSWLGQFNAGYDFNGRFLSGVLKEIAPIAGDPRYARNNVLLFNGTDVYETINLLHGPNEYFILCAKRRSTL